MHQLFDFCHKGVSTPIPGGIHPRMWTASQWSFATWSWCSRWVCVRKDHAWVGLDRDTWGQLNNGFIDFQTMPTRFRMNISQTYWLFYLAWYELRTKITAVKEDARRNPKTMMRHETSTESVWQQCSTGTPLIIHNPPAAGETDTRRKWSCTGWNFA